MGKTEFGEKIKSLKKEKACFKNILKFLHWHYFNYDNYTCFSPQCFVWFFFFYILMVQNILSISLIVFCEIWPKHVPDSFCNIHQCAIRNVGFSIWWMIFSHLKDWLAGFSQDGWVVFQSGWMGCVILVTGFRCICCWTGRAWIKHEYSLQRVSGFSRAFHKHSLLWQDLLELP